MGVWRPWWQPIVHHTDFWFGMVLGSLLLWRRTPGRLADLGLATGWRRHSASSEADECFRPPDSGFRSLANALRSFDQYAVIVVAVERARAWGMGTTSRFTDRSKANSEWILRRTGRMVRCSRSDIPTATRFRRFGSRLRGRAWGGSGRASAGSRAGHGSAGHGEARLPRPRRPLRKDSATGRRRIGPGRSILRSVTSSARPGSPRRRSAASPPWPSPSSSCSRRSAALPDTFHGLDRDRDPVPPALPRPADERGVER